VGLLAASASAQKPVFEKHLYKAEPPPHVADVELDYELHLPDAKAFPKLYAALVRTFLVGVRDAAPERGAAGKKGKVPSAEEVLKRAATAFDEQRVQLRIDLPERKTNFTDIRRVVPVHREGRLQVFEVHFWDFTGGAHGNGYTEFLWWDLEAKRQLKTFGDLFKPDSEKAVVDVVRKQLQADNNVDSDAGLTKIGFWMAHFHLGAMRPTKEAIEFVYSPYAIAPYSAGYVTVKVPRKNLTRWMPKTSPLIQK